MSESRKGIANALTRLSRAAARKAEETMRRGSQVAFQGNEIPGSLYARGFILCPEGRAPQSVASWTTWNVGQWVLHVDPRVPVDHAVEGEREIWIAGDAFHPARGLFWSMARHMLEGNMLETLDGTAGRFLMIHRVDSRVEIYHDAMGARSVFYGGGVIASHSGLVAEVLGAGLRDWVIPFITSRGYLKRDVKYLPGLCSPFENVRQLTPNTRLTVGGPVERYWPRENLAMSDSQRACATLKTHLVGLRKYLEESGLDPIVGLSAGRDSRGVLAAVAQLKPRVFTFVRSSDGKSERSEDSRIAHSLAVKAGLDLEIVKLQSPPQLDAASSPFAVTFRQNTGYLRGNNSGWVEYYAGLPQTEHVFIRGFGGEVARGFYPETSQLTPASLSNLYDVNAGSRMCRDAFKDFIDVAAWSQESLFNYPIAHMFYWEHRMGVWGSSAMLESDMAFRGVPGYNSRDLFTSFIGLAPDLDRRAIFEAAVRDLVPMLDEVPYSS